MAGCSIDTSKPAKRGFGGYTKHFWSTSIPQTPYNHLSWVNRWYTPADLRSRTPVQTHQFVGGSRTPGSINPTWVPRPDPPPKRYSLWQAEEKEMCISSPNPANSSLEWSTLRDMLPASKGHLVRKRAHKWGTSDEPALPDATTQRPNHFPKIKSPMTR